MSSFDPFAKDALAFALIMGILVIMVGLAAEYTDYGMLALVLMALPVLAAGLINFIRDKKDMLALGVLIVGVILTIFMLLVLYMVLFEF